MDYDMSAGHRRRLPSADVSRHAIAPAVHRVNALRWRQVLPGEERQLGPLRRWLASILPDCPARDDVISVASELAANAVRHTDSGRGGWFAIEITRHPSMVRVVVADEGGPAEPRVIDDPDADYGRGLLMVRALALRAGVAGDRRGRLVWAEVTFDWQDAAVAGSRDPDEAATRPGQASPTPPSSRCL